MNNQEKINFFQRRDFGETFNVSVKFLRQNFKLFFQSLIFIAGPFVLISAISGAFYQSSALSFLSIAKTQHTNIFSQFGWAYFLFIGTTIISSLVITGTAYSFMICYLEKGPNGFTVNDVGRVLIKNFGKILSAFFMFILIAVLIVTVLVGIGVGLTYLNRFLGVFYILAFIVGMLLILPPLIWMQSSVYLIRMKENLGVFQSFSRARNVMRDNFWWTWLVVVCSLIAIMIIGFVFTAPQMVYQMILMFSHLKGAAGEEDVSIPFLIVASVCTFCSTMLYSFLYVIYGFQYFSLAEKKDGIGLMERINEIGSIPNSNVEQQY